MSNDEKKANVMLHLASAGFRIPDFKPNLKEKPVDLLSKDRWIGDSESQDCQRCQKPFDLFSRKHHCRVCGALLCAGCCPNWRFPPGQPGPLRACFNCYLRLRPCVSHFDLGSQPVFVQICHMLDPWTVSRMLVVCRQWGQEARSDAVWKRQFKRHSEQKPCIARESRVRDRWLALFARYVKPTISLSSRGPCVALLDPHFKAVDIDPWSRSDSRRPSFTFPFVRERFVCPSQEATSETRRRGPAASSKDVRRQLWEFSVACLGPSGVGKTCLLYCLKTGLFRELEKTVGASFLTHTMTVKFRKPSQAAQQQLARVSFWDLGLAPFPSFVSLYTRSAHGVLFFLDLSRPSASNDLRTLQDLYRKFITRIQPSRGERQIHLILTKADLRESWNGKVVAAARDWASLEDIQMVEVSAKRDYAKVASLFERIIAPLIAAEERGHTLEGDEERTTLIRRESLQYSRTEEVETITRRRNSEISQLSQLSRTREQSAAEFTVP